jgi:catechol 2,3-dioxygenase-like lactoylglutathione lyase family enzyme
MSQAESTVVRFETVTPQITVPDLVRTVEYYRDVLGFEIAGYWDGEQVSMEPENPPVFAIVRRDKVQLFFNQAENSEVRTGRAPGAYDAGFQIFGVDALAAELRKRGADIIDGPETQVYGQRELVVADCNGLILCFAESVSD